NASSDDSFYRSIVTDQQLIAVLPFSNTKHNVDTDYLGFALANQIIGDLDYLDKFSIRPAGSIRKYVGEIIDPVQIGEELKVNYILSGNYLKENNLVRLNVELIKVPKNESIWRESIEVDYSNTFALQDLVASKVAIGLNASFTSKGVNNRYRDIPNSALAYEYYLRGISYPFSNHGHKMAVKMLEKSIELDANYAPSYAHLGNHKRLLEQHGRIKTAGSDNIEWYYKKALQLNPELLEALNNLSGFYTETNRIEEAVIVTRKMLKINPNSAASHFSLGYIYRYAGMLGEAIKEMELALAISPDNTRFRSIVATYLSAGKYKKALAKTYLDEGDYGIGYQGIIAFKQEQHGLAIEHFEQVLEIDSNGIWGLIAKVYISVINGDKKTGLKALEKMVDTNVEDAENAYYFSDFYALLEEKDKSIKMLNKAVNSGYFNYPNILSNIAFDQFRNDPTFRSILDKAKTRHDAFRIRFL
ncbi:MAG: tetratricopeptide repeat protein, partial [Kangiellaceae bacterium]|nr:tetratricopeptide repeat protein [Kangiellaceae bacterium]